MSEQTDLIEALQRKISAMETALAIYEGGAKCVRQHAADAGYGGSGDIDEMLRAIREQGRHEGSDAAREAARAVVKTQGEKWLAFYAASPGERQKEIHDALMSAMRVVGDEINAIPRPEKTWHAIPNDSGLWWFARHDGTMSLVWQAHTGIITTLWGNRVGDLDDGQWARAAVPVSPYGRSAKAGR